MQIIFINIANYNIEEASNIYYANLIKGNCIVLSLFAKD